MRTRKTTCRANSEDFVSLDTLARHSTISLTLDRYTHVSLGDEVRAIEALPHLDPAADSSLKKTGTDDNCDVDVLSSCLSDPPADGCTSTHLDAASRGEEAGEGHARRASNLRLSDPKSDGDLLPHLAQLLLQQGTCGECAMTDDERHVVQHVAAALRDEDLAALGVSWEEMPEHVRLTIRTLLRASRTTAQSRNPS